MTVYDHITQNKRRSWLLVLFFPLTIIMWLYAGVWAYYGVFLGSYRYDAQGNFVLVKSGALSVWELTNQTLIGLLPWVAGAVLVWLAVSYYYGSRMLLYFSAACPITREEEPEVYRLTENLCISQGMPMPYLCVINDHSLNSFVVGTRPQDTCVVLTTGLIARLERSELEGVIAHELAHIQNKDTHLMMLAVAYIACFTFLSEVFFRAAIRSASRLKGSKKPTGWLLGAAGGFILGMFFAVYGFMVAPLVRLALSRTREYLADASAALMTRHPLALASALGKISKDSRVEVLEAHASMSMLCIADPLPSNGVFGFLAGVGSSHPPMADRIWRLRQM